MAIALKWTLKELRAHTLQEIADIHTYVKLRQETSAAMVPREDS